MLERGAWRALLLLLLQPPPQQQRVAAATRRARDATDTPPPFPLHAPSAAAAAAAVTRRRRRQQREPGSVRRRARSRRRCLPGSWRWSHLGPWLRKKNTQLLTLLLSRTGPIKQHTATNRNSRETDRLISGINERIEKDDSRINKFITI